jgi:hypothetical protein
MEKLTAIINDHPIEGALCVFRTVKNFFVLGYLQDNKDLQQTVINLYGKKDVAIGIEDVLSYSYVLNEKGGFVFIEDGWEKQIEDLFNKLNP